MLHIVQHTTNRFPSSRTCLAQKGRIQFNRQKFSLKINIQTQLSTSISIRTRFQIELECRLVYVVSLCADWCLEFPQQLSQHKTSALCIEMRFKKLRGILDIVSTNFRNQNICNQNICKVRLRNRYYTWIYVASLFKCTGKHAKRTYRILILLY